jgi:N-acetylmuramoyl-L-alanine amidase
LARAFADAWQFRFPASKPRQDKGIYHTPTGDGAGFLRKAPGFAILTEPFFHSNPDENRFFADKHMSVAKVYCAAISAFASHL